MSYANFGYCIGIPGFTVELEVCDQVGEHPDTSDFPFLPRDSGIAVDGAKFRFIGVVLQQVCVTRDGGRGRVRHAGDKEQ